MIRKVSGKFRGHNTTSIYVDVNGISYEVILPSFILKKILPGMAENEEIELITYHYLQTDQSKSVPFLIGFTNDIEKDFFEKFISVSGIGPKAACRALNMPFSQIAAAIDRSDIPILKSLPGIGERRAREIVARLQGKVGKYALIRDSEETVTGGAGAAVEESVRDEAVEVLIQLQYRKREAEDMIDRALKRNGSIRTAEELLNEVYRQRKAGSNE